MRRERGRAAGRETGGNEGRSRSAEEKEVGRRRNMRIDKPKKQVGKKKEQPKEGAGDNRLEEVASWQGSGTMREKRYTKKEVIPMPNS